MKIQLLLFCLSFFHGPKLLAVEAGVAAAKPAVDENWYEPFRAEDEQILEQWKTVSDFSPDKNPSASNKSDGEKEKEKIAKKNDLLKKKQSELSEKSIGVCSYGAFKVALMRLENQNQKSADRVDWQKRTPQKLPVQWLKKFPDCFPDTVYSWMSEKERKYYLELLTSDAKSMLPFFSYRTPLGTHYYGDYHLRVKLASDVHYYFFDEEIGRRIQQYYRRSKQDKEFVKTLFGSAEVPDDAVYYTCAAFEHDPLAVVLRRPNSNFDFELIICNPQAVHSISYGTSQEKREQARQIWWLLNQSVEKTPLYFIPKNLAAWAIEAFRNTRIDEIKLTLKDLNTKWQQQEKEVLWPGFRLGKKSQAAVLEEHLKSARPGPFHSSWYRK